MANQPQLSTISALSAAIAAPLETSEIVEVCLDHIQSITKATSLALNISSPDAAIVDFRMVWRDNQLDQNTLIAIQEELLKHITVGQHPVHHRLSSLQGIEQPTGYSVLVPVIVRSRMIGSLVLVWDEAPLGDLNLDYAQFTIQASTLVLENLYLYNTQQYYVQALEYLSALATELSFLPAAEDIIARGEQIGCTLLKTQHCAILRTQNNIIDEIYPYGLSPAFAESIKGVDISPWLSERLSDSSGERVMLISNMMHTDTLGPWRDAFRREGIRAAMMVPLYNRDRIIGRFLFGYGRPYTPDPYEVRIAEILAAQTAAALINIELNAADQQYAEELELRVAERTEDLAVALDQAEDATRLKSQLLSTVSHELRTPLSVIKAHTTTMRSFYDRLPKEKQIHYLATINEETDRLSDMINNLLDMSRLEAGRLSIELAPVEPAPLLTKMVEALQIRFAHRSFQLVLPLIPNQILADSERVQQVINNLTENAVKYSPPEAPIEIGMCAWNDGLEFWVKDQGSGLTLDHARRIFDPFYQVNSRSREARAGFGLGLAICKALVEGMGGHIWCQSPGPGKGSKFSFTLPWANRPPS